MIDKVISEYGLKDTYAYLDDVVICGKTAEEHDRNLKNFMEVAKILNLTLNWEKSKFKMENICFLGHKIGKGQICPDPERIRPLTEMRPPQNKKELRRTMGLFSYYAKWVPQFSRRVQPIVNNTTFPMSVEAVKAFNDTKHYISEAILTAIDEDVPFTVETDASDTAISGTLNQRGKPVAFFFSKPNSL